MDAKCSAVLTAEMSGVAPAMALARKLRVPLVCARATAKKKQKEREDRPFKTLNTLNGSLPSFFAFLFRPLVDTRWILCFDRFVSCQGQEGAEQSDGGVGGHGVREG